MTPLVFLFFIYLFNLVSCLPAPGDDYKTAGPSTDLDMMLYLNPGCKGNTQEVKGMVTNQNQVFTAISGGDYAWHFLSYSLSRDLKPTEALDFSTPASGKRSFLSRSRNHNETSNFEAEGEPGPEKEKRAVNRNCAAFYDHAKGAWRKAGCHELNKPVTCFRLWNPGQ